jgi:hypothetical protein
MGRASISARAASSSPRWAIAPVDLRGSADKILEISSKLIENEAEGEHASDRVRRQAFR